MKANKRMIAILTAILMLSGCAYANEQSINQASTAAESITRIPLESKNTTSISAEEISPLQTFYSDDTLSGEIPDFNPSVPSSGNEMKVHFLDVGQGDSIFIELPNNETMLIDASTSEYGDAVVTYVYSCGYDHINYLVATHPHEDHIGGISAVIDSLNVDNIYLPEAVSAMVTYEEMLNLVEENNIDASIVKSGDTIINDPDIFLYTEVVAPVDDDYGDSLNNSSIVLRLSYGKDSFLFTGDAEKYEENKITDNIKSDVLKVGHHGSSTSTSEEFLNNVSPEYAVISCGLGNSYGHPHEETLTTLKKHNVKVFRTDTQGTVVFTTDGISLKVDKSPVKIMVDTQTTNTGIFEEVYVLNTNSKKIHKENCSSVSDMADSNKAYSFNYEEAINQGYEPCGRCKP